MYELAMLRPVQTFQVCVAVCSDFGRGVYAARVYLVDVSTWKA